MSFSPIPYCPSGLLSHSLLSLGSSLLPSQRGRGVGPKKEETKNYPPSPYKTAPKKRKSTCPSGLLSSQSEGNPGLKRKEKGRNLPMIASLMKCVSIIIRKPTKSHPYQEKKPAPQGVRSRYP
jgi:hypothetical protein